MSNTFLNENDFYLSIVAWPDCLDFIWMIWQKKLGESKIQVPLTLIWHQLRINFWIIPKFNEWDHERLNVWFCVSFEENLHELDLSSFRLFFQIVWLHVELFLFKCEVNHSHHTWVYDNLITQIMIAYETRRLKIHLYFYVKHWVASVYFLDVFKLGVCNHEI